MKFSLLHYLSWIIGKLAPLERPQFLAALAVQIFAKLVGADLSEAEKKVSEYPSVQKFFSRSLKPGVRPIGKGLVSPVDGTLRSCGEVGSEKFTEIKGRKYNISTLLQQHENLEKYNSYNYFNLYLSPKDYHHIHAPTAGKITKIDYLPGALWPVNDWSLRNIDGLLFSNERMVFYIDSEVGEIVLVMVAATNVGQIRTPFSDFVSNQTPWKEQQILTLRSDYPIAIEKGELIGSFLLGSSVLLLAPKKIVIFSELISRRVKLIKYGETIGS